MATVSICANCCCCRGYCCCYVDLLCRLPLLSTWRLMEVVETGVCWGEGLKSAFLRFELPQLVAKERSTRREDNPLHSVFLFLKSSLHLFRFCYLFFATHTGIGTGTGTHLHRVIVFLFLVVVVSLQLPRLQFTQICLVSFWVSLIVSSFWVHLKKIKQHTNYCVCTKRMCKTTTARLFAAATRLRLSWDWDEDGDRVGDSSNVRWSWEHAQYCGSQISQPRRALDQTNFPCAQVHRERRYQYLCPRANTRLNNLPRGNCVLNQLLLLFFLYKIRQFNINKITKQTYMLWYLGKNNISNEFKKQFN